MAKENRNSTESPVTVEERAKMSRRGFLGSVAAGVGAASLLESSGSAQSPAPPQNVRIASGRAALTASDLSYLGLFIMPDDPGGARFGFSNGALTARRVNGELRFFIAGALPNGDPVYEISYPGYGPNLAAAPRASLIRNWGDVYQGKRVVGSGTDNLTVRGLHWANDQLYWTYGDKYNVSSQWDPSVGATVLNANGSMVTYGPWRTQEHSQKSRGYMVTVPSWFTQYVNGATWAVGAPITSGNASSPWGAMLAAGTLPGNGTPADVVKAAHSTIATRRLIYHDIEHKQRRDSNYKFCNYNVQYDRAQGGTTRPGTPEFNSIDIISAAAWVDTPTKSGVCFFGQLSTTIPGFPYADGDTVTHCWYGPNVCPHGQVASGIWEGTGDTTATSVPCLWIYDPTNLQRVAQGKADPSAIDPAGPTQLHTFRGSQIPGNAGYQQLYIFGGAYFDPSTNLLFVSEIMADRLSNGYEPRPVIHVFGIRA